MRRLRSSCLIGLFALASCERSARSADTPVDERVAHRPLAECYRSPASVMGRTTPLDGHTGVAPGWLRFESPGVFADSGGVQLVDADGAAFQAHWRRASADSIEIRGFDDFMQITLRAALADSALTGTGLVTSDADVQRNAAGQLEPLRREWALSARSSTCDGLPVRAK